MSQYLVITAIGTDRPGICNRIVQMVGQYQGNIIDSRIALFGSEFTLTMLISGSQNTIARIETQFPVLGQEHGLITLTKRTTSHKQSEKFYRIEAHIQAEDRCGLTEQFTQFFAEREIGLFSLSAQTLYKETKDLAKDHFRIVIVAHLDSTYPVQPLEQAFEQLCSSLSVEGQLSILQTEHTTE